MAVDYITIDGNKVATDTDGASRHHQVMKLAFGADDTITLVTASAGLPVALLAGSALIGQVDVNNFPASDRTTDTASNATDVATMMSNRTELTVKFAKIDQNTTGDKVLVAAVTAKKIRVLSYDIVVAGANTITWESDPGGASEVTLSGAKSFAVNGGQVKSHPQGVMESASGKALGINIGSANQVSGELSYVEV